jgi:hypothetical protein
VQFSNCAAFAPTRYSFVDFVHPVFFFGCECKFYLIFKSLQFTHSPTDFKDMAPPALNLVLDEDVIVLTCDKLRVPITPNTKLLSRNIGNQKGQLVLNEGHVTAPVHGGTLPATCWESVGLPAPPEDADLKTCLEHLLDCIAQQQTKLSAKRTVPAAFRPAVDTDTPAKRARLDIIRGRLRELEETLEKELDEQDITQRDQVDPKALQAVREAMHSASVLNVGKLKHPKWQVAMCLLHMLLEGEVVLVQGCVCKIVE